MKTLSVEQEAAISHIYERGETFLYAGMGAGKTVVPLTAACELLRDGVVKRVLVVSTAKICDSVWGTEWLGWAHFAPIGGTPYYPVLSATQGHKATRLSMLRSDAKIICINFEKLAWLCKNDLAINAGMDTQIDSFDMLVIDESTKIKAGGHAFKAIRRRIEKNQFIVRVCMTGTPVSENLHQLFYQQFIVDAGATFGRNREKFLRKYFMPTDYAQRQWVLQSDAKGKALIDAFKQYVVKLPSYTEQLPSLDNQIVYVSLPLDALSTYKILEKKMSMSTQDGQLVATNAAVLVNKLQQCANGFVYLDQIDKGKTAWIHDKKIKQLSSILGQHALTDEKIVIAYQYDEEKIRVKRILIANRLNVTDDISTFKNWTGNGVLLLHPKSGGHGVDLTCASWLIIMSPFWSRDLTQQLIARLWRRGQKNIVHVRTLVASETIEPDIIERVKGKSSHQAILDRRLGAWF